MAIPKSQLETWSHQGSVAQSKTTYATIKNTLEAPGSPYAGKSIDVFLQGSYGNDTNIFSESDVDVLIRLNTCFQKDLEQLSQIQKDAFSAAHSDATYTHVEFKRDVLVHLQNKFGTSVKPGNKAVKIQQSGSRRNADVLIAIQFRRYHRFISLNDQEYDAGICFYNSSGARIANYPKQHLENCTAKHQATNSLFKPLVRIVKNMRGKLIEDGLLEAGVAPSYYIEGLLYNVPNDKFAGSFGDSFVNCINWIHDADRSKFVCANRQYYLLRDDPDVTWSIVQCDKFLGALIDLWKNW
jgi:hypothetical protein